MENVCELFVLPKVEGNIKTYVHYSLLSAAWGGKYWHAAITINVNFEAN